MTTIDTLTPEQTLTTWERHQSGLKVEPVCPSWCRGHNSADGVQAWDTHWYDDFNGNAGMQPYRDHGASLPPIRKDVVVGMWFTERLTGGTPVVTLEVRTGRT